MQITDLNGMPIEVTDLGKAIMMAKRFMKYRHMDKAYIQTDNKLFAYWSDMHDKLVQKRETLKKQQS